MKILLVTDTYIPYVNGAAYFTSRLAHALQESGHDVTVMTTSCDFSDSQEMRENIPVYGIKSIWLPSYNNFRVSPMTFFRKHVHDAVKKINPDIIHLQNHFMIGRGAYEAARDMGIPIIGTNHFMPENLVHYSHLPAWGEKKLCDFGWWQFKKVYDHIPFVTAPTATAGRITESSGLNKKVLAISNGIDTKWFTVRIDGSYLKKKFSIPEHHILLYVGRLDQEKRLEVIVKAMPEIRRSIDAHLVFAGVGGLKQDFEQMVQSMGLSKHVTFTGFIDNKDLPAIYHVGDVFVIASIAELQSLVTMEAMASGLPVIAADAQALPELVHDGENGFLFPPGDVRAYAKQAIRLLRDDQLRRQMGKKSLDIIQSHDIKHTVESFVALYRKAIAAKNKGSA